MGTIKIAVAAYTRLQERRSIIYNKRITLLLPTSFSLGRNINDTTMKHNRRGVYCE